MIFDLNINLNKALDYINRLALASNKIDIKILRGKRSLKQNAYFHGVICTIFGNQFGLTPIEAKQDLAKEFLSYEKNGTNYTKSTSDLNTLEFEQFNSQCRIYASNNGCWIPKPNEITDDMFNEIEKLNNRIYD